MKYTFYRPNELNTTEFDKIISDMHDVLVRIRSLSSKLSHLV